MLQYIHTKTEKDMNNTQLKSTLRVFYEYCDKIEQKGCFKSVAGRSLKEYLRHELLKYLLFLSDKGEVNVNELYFINEVLGYDFSAKAVGETYKTLKIAATFAQRIPDSLKTFVSAETELKMNDTKRQPSRLLVDFYRNLGICYTACDNYADDDQVYKLTDYVLSLQKYLSEAIGYEQKNIPLDSAGGVPEQSANAKEEAEKEKKPRPVEEVLAELDSLVGLEDVKKDVNSLVNLIKVRKLRSERNIKQIDMSLHMVFSGNPGTGKTTVARLLAEIYASIGLLPSGQLVETDRTGLVAGYVGQTALKTKEIIDKAMGGVLFIDEAYALTQNRGQNDFGQEAVDTLLKAMEDNRDKLVVIVAGYTDLMKGFVDSNPGLRSRFNKYILFKDYSAEELLGILKMQCRKGEYELSYAAEQHAEKFFLQRIKDKPQNYANGRDVRNFFEKAVVFQANRLAKLNGELSDAQLKTLELEDVINIRL